MLLVLRTKINGPRLIHSKGRRGNEQEWSIRRFGLGAKLLGIIMNLCIIHPIQLYKITMKTIGSHLEKTTRNKGPGERGYPLSLISN